ncbi:hypothetical protein TNCV_1081531 [Trichonephila clavipes]|nr:hypothetical protein TNCV_1081531 [Trichonephila clavipes]
MPSPFSINPTHLTAPRRLIRRLPFITRTCSRAKATGNDRRHLALCHDEFRGPRSGLCRSGGISNITTR